MRENVGHIDRAARFVLGPALMGLGFAPLRAHEGRISGILAIVAGAMILESAITRVCPINAALHIDTRSNAEKLRDFRADVNEQTERITHDYGQRPLPMA